MTTETMSKAKSLTLVGVAYVIAIAVAAAAWLVWGPSAGPLVAGHPDRRRAGDRR